MSVRDGVKALTGMTDSELDELGGINETGDKKMNKPTGYRLTITTDEGEVIGSLSMDGVDLRKASDRQMIAEDIAVEIGGTHVEQCADLPGLDD